MNMMTPMEAGELDPDLCYRALLAKDARFDGRFFVCVASTGIYCRPVCPARTPRREHCSFVPSAAAAEAAGFRSCLRCRPEAAPGTPAWAGTAATVSRALRLIEEGALDHGRLDDLAARLGMGERQLRRLFIARLGAGPQAVAANRRLLTAKQLISETTMPLSEVAFAAGYQSLRRFNDAIRQAYGVSPSEIRRTTNMQAGGAIRLRLGYRPPFNFASLLTYLGQRALPGIEHVKSKSYHRSFHLGGVTGTVSVTQDEAANALIATVTPLASDGSPIPVRAIVTRLRRLFDLDAEPDAIATAFANDPLLAPRLRRLNGLRVPGAFDPFELSIRAILGQQVSVKGATTLAARIVAKYGTPLEPAPTDTAITHIFPMPEHLAQADLSGLGLTGGRISTLQHLSKAVAEALDFAPRENLDAKVAELTSLPGIGEWTAHYICLRAVGEPDAFPASDLGLRKAAGNGTPITSRELSRMAESWRPWRGYAALALWQG